MTRIVTRKGDEEMFKRRNDATERAIRDMMVNQLEEVLPRAAAMPRVANIPAPPKEQVARESPFAPPSADPIRMASLMLKSVHKVGTEASREVEQIADMVMQGAQELSDHLRQLAAAIRGHSDEAAQHVEAFAAKATSALEGVRALAEEFNAPVTAPPTVEMTATPLPDVEIDQSR